jgi:hypothetical protein
MEEATMTPDNIDTKALRELVPIAEAIEDPPSAAQVRARNALAAAAPALLDKIEAQRKEIEHRDGRIKSLCERVSYYESALCFTPPRLWALPPDGVVTGTIEPERVGEVLAERDALKAEVERLNLQI